MTQMRSVLRVFSWVLFVTAVAFIRMLSNPGGPMRAVPAAVDIVTALILAFLFAGQALMTLVMLRRVEHEPSLQAAGLTGDEL